MKTIRILFLMLGALLMLAPGARAQSIANTPPRPNPVDVPSFDLLGARGDEEWQKVAFLLGQLPAVSVPMDKAIFSRVLGEEQALLARAHQGKSIASMVLADGVDWLITERQLTKAAEACHSAGQVGSGVARTGQTVQDLNGAYAPNDFSRIDRLNRSLESALDELERVRTAMRICKMATPEQSTLDKVPPLRNSLSAEWSSVISEPGRGTPAERLLLWKWLRLRFESDPVNSANRIPFTAAAIVRPELETSPAVREEVALLLGGLNAVRARAPLNLPTAPTGSATAVPVASPGERVALAYLDGGLERLRVRRVQEAQWAEQQRQMAQMQQNTQLAYQASLLAQEQYRAMEAQREQERREAAAQRRYQARLTRRWGPTLNGRLISFQSNDNGRLNFEGASLGIATTRHLGAPSADGGTTPSWLGVRFEAQVCLGATHAWLAMGGSNQPQTSGPASEGMSISALLLLGPFGRFQLGPSAELGFLYLSRTSFKIDEPQGKGTVTMPSMVSFATLGLTPSIALGSEEQFDIRIGEVRVGLWDFTDPKLAIALSIGGAWWF
jgi:hypothetical protein